MRSVVALLAVIVIVAAAVTADARPIGEDQKKAKKKASAFTQDDYSAPSKSRRSERMRRRTERNVEEDFRTGIGDSKGKGRRARALGGDDEDE